MQTRNLHFLNILFDVGIPFDLGIDGACFRTLMVDDWTSNFNELNLSKYGGRMQ